MRVKKGTPIPDIHRVEIKSAGTVRLAALQAYLSSQGDFTEECLKSINFLDHLLRETPSKTLINLRRAYFVPHEQEGKQMMTIGGGVEAIKGVYQSLRIAEGQKLIVTTDVSNSCFWNRTSFDRLCLHMCSTTQDRFEGLTRWHQGRPKPNTWQIFKRLSKSSFYVKHRGVVEQTKIMKRVEKILDDTAETYKFEWKDAKTGKTKTVNVAQYFHERYGVRLNLPYLPLVQARKNEVYPMEVCVMPDGQRYPAKLNEDQTSKMIKFAATRPEQRKESIRYGLSKINWQADPFLKNYGLKINPNMLTTNARVLEPPEVSFKGSVAKPGTSGRWDLKGKVFIAPSPKPLESWGVLVMAGTEGGDKRSVPSREQVNNFVQTFIKIYKGHGGVVKNTNPAVTTGVPDTAEAVKSAFQNAGNQAKMRPQMLMVIVTNKSADVYNRIKANCDCRFGLVSQCVQSAQIIKANPQYCSNVSLKFNNKLGGTNSIIKPKTPYFREPTMIIGADVTHAAPGTSQASIAAITMSMDQHCARYCAGVQVNGFRTEMIEQKNMIELVQPLIQKWTESVGGGRLPKHVYYFRDGVSEGQYIPLIKNEVADLKKAFSLKTDGKAELMPKFTVVVVEKRHHIRFFPDKGPAGDSNGNPVPGMIVDRDVTHPFEEDFYLNSHKAIQGTSRPTHYHILTDEYKVPIDVFQKLTYEHCYQYQRATTPVSIFPAVYYAHLAAARSVSHIDISAQAAWEQKHEANERGGRPPPGMQGNVTAPPDLRPMEKTNQIQFSMWYI